MIVTKTLVQQILEEPMEHDWTIQGLGMLRMYLDEGRTLRLHVWSDAARYENVSELHTHPWDMLSQIVVGELRQHRFVPSLDDEVTHMCQKILCGEGGGLCDAPRPVGLRAMLPEEYVSGDTYRQLWWEIHRSEPMDGTVTCVKREFTSDPDHAYVFWPAGEEWVTAEPRPATEEEVLALTENALEKWF